MDCYKNTKSQIPNFKQAPMIEISMTETKAILVIW